MMLNMMLCYFATHDAYFVFFSSDHFATQAYKENMLNFIFRLDSLDIGAVARAYGLLR